MLFNRNLPLDSVDELLAWLEDRLKQDPEYYIGLEPDGSGDYFEKPLIIRQYNRSITEQATDLENKTGCLPSSEELSSPKKASPSLKKNNIAKIC